MLIYYINLNILIELNIASNDTPTSANIASHIVDIPIALSTNTITFILSANTIF